MNKEIDTDSEQHRKECEARHALSMNDTRRQAYYQGVKDKRGEKAVNELLTEVKRQRKLMNLGMEM